MKGKAGFHMYFYIRKNRVDDNGITHIYLRLTIGGEQLTVSISRRVKSSNWDNTRGCVKPQATEAAEINRYIALLRSKAYDAYQTLLAQGRIVTPYAISEVLWGSKQRAHTLIALFERHNMEMEAGIGISSTNGNYKNYKTSLRYIKEFLQSKYRRNDLVVTDIDQGFITDYSLFLQTVKNCHHNGAMKQQQRLKKVFGIAVRNGWLQVSPFDGYKLKFKPYDKIILTYEELRSIEGLTSLSPKLKVVRDAFIFSCYTGLAYVDMRNLTQDKLQVGVDGMLWIILRRKKSEIKARIPLLPKALALLDQYKDHKCHAKGRMIPVFSNQKTNDYLKELAVLAQIDKPVSFHTARHVFATVVMLSNGVPIETVSKALGHSDIRTTQVYARVLDEKIASDFNKLRDKL